MKHFDATRSNEAPLHCYYCGRPIVDGNWFARIKLGEGRIAICRPDCIELFLETPDRCAGAIGKTSSTGRSETVGYHPRKSAEVATAGWDWAACNRPMATTAMRFVGS
jgi:hypothetical protein